MGWFSNWKQKRAAAKKEKKLRKLEKKMRQAQETLAACVSLGHAATMPAGVELAGDENYALSAVPYAGVDVNICRDCNNSIDTDCTCDCNHVVIYIDEDGDAIQMHRSLTEYAADTIAGVFVNFGIEARSCHEEDSDDVINQMDSSEEEITDW